MSDKKIKFLGITVYKRKTKGNTTITRFLNVPVWKKVKELNKNKYYLFGMQIYNKKTSCIRNKIENDNKSIITKIVEGHVDSWYGLDKNKLNVAIKFSGGLGDILINYNYIDKLIKKYKNDNINFYICGNENILNFIIKENPLITKKYKDLDLSEDSHAFDVLIKLVRFPHIKWANKKKVFKFSEEFFNYIVKHEIFMLKNPRFFESGRTCDGQTNILSKIEGKNRVSSPDILNILNIKDIDITIAIPQNKDLRKDYQIDTEKYITIHRGNDIKNSHFCTKLWPLGYYSILTGLLKEKFPEYKIVQLGVNEERCPAMENIDISLVGKTSLDDIAYILKHSSLHIDAEGGFAHLRHALKGGKSVVLFGPTDKNYYGYPENINISTDICRGCEWVREKWLESCVKGDKNPACMYSITPELVISKIIESEVLNEKL